MVLLWWIVLLKVLVEVMSWGEVVVILRFFRDFGYLVVKRNIGLLVGRIVIV